MAGRHTPAPKLRPGLLRDPVHLLALGFGTGLSPVGPGTMGTLLALPLAFALTQMPLSAAITAVAIFVLGGVWICGESARRLGCHDHPGIVWDEIAAFAALALALPPGPWWLVLGFVLFRVFDIVKPWPIRELDHRLRGGLGIMLDDLAAACCAGISARVIEAVATVIGIHGAGQS
jgi:phosphatidylglycerophosphatase A